MSNKEKFEREFAAFLAEEDSRLADAYRKLPQLEPDARLDGAIRAMAQRALNPRLVTTPQVSASQHRRGRWVPALGAAAGIVLAAGIALRLGPSWHGDRSESGAPAADVISVRSTDAPAPPPAPLSPPPPPAESAPAPASAASMPVTAKAKLQTEAEAVPPPADTQLREKAAAADDGETSRAAGGSEGALSKANAPPGSTPRPAVVPAPARKRAEIDAVERKQLMATGASQSLHDRDAAKQAPSTAGAGAPVADERASYAAKPAEPHRQEELRVAAPVQSTTQAPASRPAPAAPAARAPTNAPVAEQFAPEPPAKAPAAAASPPRTEAPSRADAAHDIGPASAAMGTATQKKEDLKASSQDPNARLYPEHWLENIRTLLRENHRDEAVRSLAEFRRMYPDYRLPDDLRDLK